MHGSRRILHRTMSGTVRLRRLTAVTHISHEIALGDFMTASPSREKPRVDAEIRCHKKYSC